MPVMRIAAREARRHLRAGLPFDRAVAFAVTRHAVPRLELEKYLFRTGGVPGDVGPRQRRRQLLGGEQR